MPDCFSPVLKAAISVNHKIERMESDNPPLGTYPLKVLNAGFFRAGTASLSVALVELGFGPTWHICSNSDEFTQKGSKWWIDNDIMKKLNNNEYVNFDEWFEIIKCQSIMDAPNVYIWEKIFKQYPKCKVIVCVRDFEGWYESFRILMQIFGSTKFKIAAFFDKWINLLLYEYFMYYNDFNLWLAPKTDKKSKILIKQKYYDNHIKRVKEIVPKDQLLIYNIKDGWEPLCNFLNVPIPTDQPFPCINLRKDLIKFNEHAANQIIKNGIIYKVLPFIVLTILIAISVMWFASA